MPFVNIKVVREQTTAEQKKRIIEGLTELIATIMNRERKMTVITIDELSEDQWAIGGKLISQIQPERILTFVNIKVSKGTTNPVEVREMMTAVKELMIDVLGNSDECNYFVIDELNPDFWGYDSMSMTDRRNLQK